MRRVQAETEDFRRDIPRLRLVLFQPDTYQSRVIFTSMQDSPAIPEEWNAS
jgi:hypothetical protein